MCTAYSCSYAPPLRVDTAFLPVSSTFHHGRMGGSWAPRLRVCHTQECDPCRARHLRATTPGGLNWQHPQGHAKQTYCRTWVVSSVRSLTQGTRGRHRALVPSLPPPRARAATCSYQPLAASLCDRRCLVRFEAAFHASDSRCISSAPLWPTPRRSASISARASAADCIESIAAKPSRPAQPHALAPPTALPRRCQRPRPSAAARRVRTADKERRLLIETEAPTAHDRPASSLSGSWRAPRSRSFRGCRAACLGGARSDGTQAVVAPLVSEGAGMARPLRIAW